MFRRSSGEPLRPPSVVHRRPRVAAFLGRQHHVTRRHGRATQDTQGTAEVHASLGEPGLELLLGEEVARLGEEGVERHADGAGDVARLCVCQGERGNRLFYYQTDLIHT